MSNANERIQWLHSRITEERYPNAQHLSERFSVSHRQAQRDVDYLRTTLGAPLAYNAKHRGFYYSAPFTLSTYTAPEGEAEYVEVLTGERTRAADREILQMQIPYSAVISIKNKLTRLELGGFIVGERAPHEYVCEFQNVEVFLSVLFHSGADITVLEPLWLRERLVEAARRILKNNE